MHTHSATKAEIIDRSALCIMEVDLFIAQSAGPGGLFGLTVGTFFL